ncbi:MAG TPA: ABC transporter ATP-binding protein [Syntrophomonas sp.]|jgi:macrolide transport system ATP-binding/permease protein|nr:ABC transporter ATP-binding protein [Syntrophomonas sp.]
MFISCRGIKKSFGDRMVLNGIDLDIGRGDRIGLVGRNGSGKTTLANILTGCLDYDEGSMVTAAEQIKIGYLRQTQAEAGPFSQVVNGEFQRLTSYLGMNQVQEWSQERLQNLSGGEKTKIALAGILASAPDLLILDEPTNHMDYQGVDFLLAKLAAYRGAVVIISHDRYFLDQTVAQIAEIEKGTITLYQGNYSWYREAREKERQSRQHTYESQKKEQGKIEADIARLKGWSAKAHRESRKKAEGMMGGKEYYRKKAKKRDQAIKSQIKRLEKMQREEIKRPEAETQVKFSLDSRLKGGRRLLEAEHITKTYGDLLVFKDSSFYINRGEKVGILGPNGCGKTTLFKTILGQEILDAGKIFLSPAARVAYVGQELPQNENWSLKQLVRDRTIPDQKNIFRLMVELGIAYDRLNIPLDTVSRGERMKIAIGMAIIDECDLLMLDEPANHLDLYSRESLEESLIRFPGSMLIVSHDRCLLEKVCAHMLIFKEHRISRAEGNLADYLNIKTSAPAKKDREEEKLLLETQISRVISQLSQYKPDDPRFAALDQEYKELIKRRNRD